MPRDRFVLTLDALGSPAPLFVRLRRLLKAALRQFCFRCVRCVYADGRPLDLGAFAVPEQPDRLQEAIRERLARIEGVVAGARSSLPESLADAIATSRALIILDDIADRLEAWESILDGTDDLGDPCEED